VKQSTIADAPAILNMNDRAMWVLGWNAAAEASQVSADVALLREAVRFGQFSDDMLKQWGLAEPLRQALFRVVGEANVCPSGVKGDANG
jgi:hypothetical protein